MKFICDQESVKYSEDTLQTIIDASEGDLRKAITNLQSCATLVTEGEEIRKSDAIEVTGIIPNELLERFLEICASKQLAELQKFVENFLLEAYSVRQVCWLLFPKYREVWSFFRVRNAKFFLYFLDSQLGNVAIDQNVPLEI